MLQEAYVDGLNGPDLFEGMYADDTEGKKLKEMPGVDELVMLYPLYTNIILCFSLHAPVYD
jgi:hypothetical protein